MTLGSSHTISSEVTSSSATSPSSNSSDEEDDGETGTLEPWIEWLQRAARNIGNKLQGIRSEDWVVSARKRKWRFAGKVARCTDGRWSKRLLLWKPRGFRNRGRPCTRWEADIASVAGGGWIDFAADEEFWRLVEEGYLTAGVAQEKLGFGLKALCFVGPLGPSISLSHVSFHFTSLHFKIPHRKIHA